MKHKHQKYIDELLKVKQIISTDQKILLTDNKNPVDIAREINELENISGHISTVVNSLYDDYN